MRYASSVFLPDEQATTSFGARLAPLLAPGDTILLEGPIGAGKTSLARAVIQARLAAAGRHEDVPSPTYTLVQTYDDGACEIWHADLYRLGDPGEIVELGLDEAFETAIVLVEWPDRLGDLAPATALHLRLSVDGEGRLARLTGPAERWDKLAAVQAADA